jgi:PadR family transcriptional regulator, regulatory protein AphA
MHEEYKKIEERLENIADSPRKMIRLKALRYGLSLLESEIKWLNDEKGK